MENDLKRDDLIRRSDVLRALGENAAKQTMEAYDFYGHGRANGIVAARDLVRNFPAVDAVEVVHGRWVKMDMHRGMENYKCSVCRSECYVPETMGEPMFPLCPYCGSRMDGRREGGNINA